MYCVGPKAERSNTGAAWLGVNATRRGNPHHESLPAAGLINIRDGEKGEG